MCVRNTVARLNLCDCAAYALAKRMKASLLFKGNDFTHTDLQSSPEKLILDQDRAYIERKIRQITGIQIIEAAGGASAFAAQDQR
jgi:hypothetical protein